MGEMTKMLLLDVDGVLMLQPKYFSQIYSEEHNIPLDTILPFFFSDEFLDCSVGKNDLKHALAEHNDKWQWNGSSDELLQTWFDAELYPNTALITYAKFLRKKGVRIGIATQQERYRTEFLKQVFKDMYDEFFVSCEIGYHKESDQYWDTIVEQLSKKAYEVIAYFDDKRSLVDVARKHGINAHLYETVGQIKKITQSFEL